MLWAAIVLPELPLSSAFRAGTDGACAVIHGPENRPQLLTANAAAAALGVRAGQAPIAARALAADLRLHRRDEAGEQRLLEQLAAWAYGYSGMVALAPPDALLLEVGASLRLFGGWPALERQLRGDLETLGHAHRIAAAPTPLGARVLADTGDGTAVFDEARLATALGHVAIAAAHLPDKAVAALHAMGLRQVRDLLRLPRPELARRVGRDVLDHVDRLRGSVADPRPLYRPPDRFHARIEFEAEVASSEALLFPLLRLTRELAAFLLGRDGGVQHFELVLEHELHAARGDDGVRAPGAHRPPAPPGIARPRVGAAHGCDPGTPPARATADRRALPHDGASSRPPTTAERRTSAVAAMGSSYRGARHGVDSDGAGADHRGVVAADTRGVAGASGSGADTGARRVGDASGSGANARGVPGADGSGVAMGTGRVAGAGGRGDSVRHDLGRVHCDGTIGSVTRVPVGLLEPVRAADMLFELARGRLERVSLPAPARALVLEAVDLPAFVPAGRDLFEQRPGAGLDWPALAERLRARLGDHAVRGFVVHPDHRPECAWREASPQARRTTATQAGPLRPVWLLPRALPLRGRVARLVGGPERIETGWWDGYDVRRDYYVADLDSGQRAWLYREVGGGDDWMLQGWFA